MSEENSNSADVEAIARRLTYRPETRLPYFRALPLSTRSAVFNIFSPAVRQDVMAALPFNEVVELLDHLDPHRAYHILSKMKDKKRRERLISRVKSDRFEKIEYFLQFHPQATVSLLHLNYVFLSEATTVGDAAAIIEDHLRTTGKIPVVLVSRDGELLGEVPLSALVKASTTGKIKNYLRPVKAIAYNTKREDVLSLFTSSAHEKVVVIDTDGSVMGVVYSDDVIDLMEDQPADYLYDFASVESNERPFDSVGDKVRNRYRWLIINLATCCLAAAVVYLFEDAIEQLVILAVLMPIVEGMGNNAATQTLAVIVRGIAIGEISLKNSRQAIINEMLAGLINGTITGLILVPIVLILGAGVWVAILGGLSVIFGLVLGGFCGAFIPLILKHFGKDPATSAGVLISTINDVLVFGFLLGVATLFLI